MIRGGFSLNAILNEAVEIFIYSRSVWFFIQLFFAHILFYLIYTITRNQSLRIILNLLVWALLIAFCNTEVLRMWRIKWLYGFLLLGFICRKYNVLEKVKSKKKSVLIGAFVIFLLGWVASTIFSGGVCTEGLSAGFNELTVSLNILKKELWVWVCGLTGIITWYLASLFMSRFKLFEILYRMGGYTLDIYVVHMMIIFMIKYVPLPEKGIFLIGVVISFFFICIPIYLLTKYLLRRIKLYRLIT